MQLRHGIKKSRHRCNPLPRKLRPSFLWIELLQTPPQHLPRRIDLPPLPLLNHQPEHLPHVFHRLIMFPPVAQHMHRPHDSPTLQLADRRAHIRPCHAQRLRNLIRRQRARRQIEQRMDLRHRPVNPPPRPHLTPGQNVSLLHPRQSRHVSSFSSNGIYRTNHPRVNQRYLRIVIPHEVRNLLLACATAALARTPTPPPSRRATWCQLLGTRYSSSQTPRLPSPSEPSSPPPPASAPDTA